MECNRDEAVRAKEIADIKLSNQDISGAKKFALKAQCLYPQLDGLSQLMTTIEVYISSTKTIAGEIDWYGVLSVSPTADEETIKKQYRKLALMLHPDKNKSPGADGAFKLICEAWSLLSDKSKRLAYNQRRLPKAYVQMRPNNSPSVPSQSNGVYGPPSAPKAPQVPPKSVPRAPLSVPKQPPPLVRRQTPSVAARASSHQLGNTFWTICHGCKMHYEYLRQYLNHTLLCPNCRKAFLASEAPPPPGSSNFTSCHRKQQNSNNHAPPTGGARNSIPAPQRNAESAAAPKGGGSGPGLAGAHSHKIPTSHAESAAPKGGSGSGLGGVHSFKNPTSQQYMHSQNTGFGRVDPSIAVKAVNVVQQAQERMKRDHYNNTTFSGEGLFKKARFDENGANTSSHNRINPDLYSGLRKTGFEPGFSSFYNKPNNSTRELTPIETRNMLMGKARKAILKKLNDIKQHSKSKNAEKSKTKKAVIGQKQDFHGTTTDDSSDDIEKKPLSEEPVVTEDPVVDQSMDVPDSDFHEFDQDRTESCFNENEVWAGYDDDDGMPRFYAIINKVISRKPFKLKLGWINSKTNSEFSTSLDWLGSGFYKTCGEFRLGRYEINKAINVFSHKVRFSKGPRGIIQIYPKKGDVWALYRNWAPNWNKDTPDEVIHKYDMILVLEDYNEEEGVSVAPLVKVFGFKSVFRPSDSDYLEKAIHIPKQEMFRFSHQVPHYTFTGEEPLNASKGFLELDPAATPIDLLDVETDKNSISSEVKDDEVVNGVSPK